MHRGIRCVNLKEVRAELDRLGGGPQETTGHWSYFQILDHLTNAVEGSLKGVRRETPFWKRRILAPLLVRLFALRGYIPAGIKGRPVERVEGDWAQALLQYRKALNSFEKHEGSFSDHPILGHLNKKQWENFHAMHFANHAGWTKENPKISS